VIHSWIWFPKRLKQRRLRLLCLPHAGGGATFFQSWLECMHPEMELCAIQLPGRETRLSEPPFTSLRELVRALSLALRPLVDEPYAVFGHSMGALVAFELCRELRRCGLPMPAGLFVSGRPAPHIVSSDRCIRWLPDAAFVSEVARRYNGIPESVMAEPELLALVTPALRADISMVETYSFYSEAPLEIPISAFCGLEDASVDFEEMRAWAEHTHAEFRMTLLPGGHFFPQSNRAMLISRIVRDLEPHLHPAAHAART
jgi:medium-chain acyl-[acyl-carrier-protein] hydrolase